MVAPDLSRAGMGTRRWEELRSALPLTAANALVIASLYVLKPARSALFLSERSAAELPWVLLLVAAAGASFAAGFGRATRDWPIDRLVPRTLLSLSALLIGCRWAIDGAPSGPVVYGFFVAVTLYGLLATSLVWLLAGASCQPDEARRTFGLIGAGGIAGAVAGGWLTALTADRIGTENLVLLGAALAAAAVPFLRSARPLPLAGSAPAVRSLHLSELRAHPLLRSLAVTTFLVAAAAVIVDVQFNAVVAEAFPDRDEKAAFFGVFFAGLSAFGFVFQVTLTAPLLRRFGVGSALTLLPATLGAGSLLVLFAPGLFSGAAAKAADGGFRHSVHKAASEVAFLPVPVELKKPAKLFLDTAVDTSASGLGALAVLVLGAWLPLHLASGLAVALLFAALFTVRRLQRAYVDAFREAISARRVDEEALRSSLTEAASLGLLRPALASERPRTVLYALELLAGAGPPGLAAELDPLLLHPNPKVRAKALRLRAGLAPPPAQRAIEALALDPDLDVRVEALRGLVLRFPSAGASWIQAELSAEDPARRVGAAVAAARLGRGLDLTTVVPWLEDEAHEPWREDLAQALAAAEEPRLDAMIDRLLDTSPGPVARALVEGLGRGPARRLPLLIDRIEHAELRGPIRAALVAQGRAAVPAVAALLDPSLGRTQEGGQSARALPRILGRIPHPESMAALLRHVDGEDPLIRRAARRALVRLRSRNPELVADKAVVLRALTGVADRHRSLRSLRATIDGELDRPGGSLLIDSLLEAEADCADAALDLAGLRCAPSDLTRARWGLRPAASPSARASARELLENVLPTKFRSLVLPMLDGSAMNPAGESGLSVESALAALVRDESAWLRAVAAHVAAAGFASNAGPSYRRPVLSVVEKVIFLRGVDVFSEVPAEQLAHLAAIAEERAATGGERLYDVEDRADGMFLVVEGQVRLHRGPIEVGTAGPGDGFGTWALFDDEPRLTAATAMTDAELLHIAKLDLQELLADNPEISQAILETVVRRLRSLGRAVRGA